ncbi:IRK-interacting protein [Benincasa hispida]|uniref:IRK-interacting protein n=1 Tax=Benincasa hispida TaxID=102211 RepID=UPI001901D84E|nr:IRK-interacting protein [Benincasa hispida]
MAAAPSPTSFNSSPAPTLHHCSSLFTPIQESEREGREDAIPVDNRTQNTAAGTGGCTDRGTSPKHHSTPLNRTKNGKSHTVKKRSESESDSVSSSDGPVSCNRCRPHVREKISVVPLDNNNGVNKQTYFSMASPNGIFKSLISSLTRKSPKSINESSALTAREEQWRAAVTELSQKLVQATRKRDEAIMEASRLKYAMAELEKKLDKLETYCHGLKSGIEECSGNSPCQIGMYNQIQSFQQRNQKQVIEHFLVSVSESRSSIRLLSRSLTLQLRHVGAKVYERISVLLQPYDVKISFSKNPRSMLFYLEALLNQAFFEDFESIGFQKNASTQVLNPIERCETNFECFNFLHELTWEEVLSKGTKHFSEDFSRFCDRKMSEIVAMLGWNRAWPEPLLQAFFSASKSVWLLHLLANSVHPNLPIFRVDKEADFDSVYMEDMGGDKARKLIPSLVRIMIAPGFYVYGSVVKCKVLCRYNAATAAATAAASAVTAAALSP